MRTLRTALTAAALCLLCLGYAASQIAYFQGTFVDYAAKVDSPPVQRLALLFLLAAVVLAFIKDHEKDNTSEASNPSGDLRFTTYDLRNSVDSRFTIHDSQDNSGDLRFTTYDLRGNL